MSTKTEKAQRAPLSMSAIVDAALGIVDAEGLERLTMRRLGASLGVEAMTLYHYVASKDVLLDRLVERVVTRATLVGVDEGSGWRARLEAFARR